MLVLIILGIIFMAVFGSCITLASGYDPNNLKCVAYRSDNFVAITVSSIQNGYSNFCDGSHESEHYFIDQGYHIAASGSLEIYLVK